MKARLAIAVSLILVPVVLGAERTLDPTFESDGNLSPRGKIDRTVFAKLRQEKIEPARLCSDAVFLRRVYIDVIGTLPTAEEARQFLTDPNPNKRRDLIDTIAGTRRVRRILGAQVVRSCCASRRSSRSISGPTPCRPITAGSRPSLKENMRYDEFVRAIVCSSGSNFRDPQVNFYRSAQTKQPEALARAVALTFMGTRADKWPPEKLAEMAVFFSLCGLQEDGRVERRDRLLRFPEVPDRRAEDGRAAGRLDRRTACPARTRARSSPIGSSSPRIPTFAKCYRQPRLVLVAGPRDRPRTGRHPSGQSGRPIPSCWRCWSRSCSRPSMT